MKYTIEGFSQDQAIKLGLDIKDLVLLRWMVDFCGTGIMECHHVNNEKYYWFNYGYLIQNLPILRIKALDYLGKRLKELSVPRKVGSETIPAILTLKMVPTSTGNRMYFRFVPEVMKKLLSSEPPVKKVGCHPTKNTGGCSGKTLVVIDDSSISDSSITDSKQPGQKAVPAPFCGYPVSNSGKPYSRQFLDKAKKAELSGFNIFQLTNRFYKVSKLIEPLPEQVLSDVLDKYLNNGQVRDVWPYFLRVLSEKSREYFASRSVEEAQSYKQDPASLGAILAKLGFKGD